MFRDLCLTAMLHHLPFLCVILSALHPRCYLKLLPVVMSTRAITVCPCTPQPSLPRGGRSARGTSLKSESVREGIVVGSPPPRSPAGHRQFDLGPSMSEREEEEPPQWTPMYVTEAERIMLHCASCKVPIDGSGHSIAMLMDTRVPMALTLLAMSLGVSCCYCCSVCPCASGAMIARFTVTRGCCLPGM